jgi:BNR repeat protein
MNIPGAKCCPSRALSWLLTITTAAALPAVGGSFRIAVAEDPSGPLPRIEWDPKTLTLVERGAGYGRIVRLRDGRLLCTYDRGGKVWVRPSVDEGKSWREPVLAASFPPGVATNPELLQLHDGTLLLSYNERPNDGRHRFAIAVTSSADGGGAWSAPRRLYEADTRPENGCWEPCAVQLPGGEIQLYFANESPYRSSSEQEISLLRSADNGRTWSGPVRVSFRQGHRDGMPVPLVLQSPPGGVAVAIEDSGLQGGFKPVIVWTDPEDMWRSGPVLAESPRRWSALRQPLPASVVTGAPYLRQMPTGETVLSFQSRDEGRKEPHMVVYLGNRSARDFTSRSVPFKVPSDVACLWNALFVKSRDTVTAISGTRLHGTQGLWAVDGRLVR